MGAKSSKTKPAQPSTVVETFNAGESGDGTATSASSKRTRSSNSQRRGSQTGSVVKDIWNAKTETPPSQPTKVASPPPSPQKRAELQVSSDEDSDAGHATKALTKKKSRRKKRKEASDENASPQKASTIKLNEVQVVKRPPGDVSPERQHRFEQIKVAYSMRDITPRSNETPSPSRAESKAESMARFFGREAKPSASPGGSSSALSTHSKAEDATCVRPPSSANTRPPSGCQSSKGADPGLRAQGKDEQQLQFHARYSEQDSTELLDIDDLEREESLLLDSPSSRQANNALDDSKVTESRSASLPASPKHRQRSPVLSLRLDDADESFMSAILHDN